MVRAARAAAARAVAFVGVTVFSAGSGALLQELPPQSQGWRVGQASAIDLDIASTSELARYEPKAIQGSCKIASPASGAFRQRRSASMPSATATTTQGF